MICFKIILVQLRPTMRTPKAKRKLPGSSSQTVTGEKVQAVLVRGP